MRRALAAMILLAAAVRPAAAQDDPVVALEKRVQETARKASAAFVFLSGGSGVLISDDGWCLTNHHVVAPPVPVAPGTPEAKLAKRVPVNLQDAKGRFALLVCTDPVGDIALLKLEPEAGEKFPFLEFTDSDKLETGQYVLAIGAPFGIGAQGDPAPDHRHYPSVSLGIISALHRYQEQYGDCIQTDAAVNPGNSGGPLVDLDGRLAGINGRILTRYGNRVNSGVGFAVPANQIRNFLPRMKIGGIDRKIYHGEIGGLRIGNNEIERTGAVVRTVDTGSAADRAGLKEDDLIVAVNGQKVTTARRFLGLISTWPAGAEVTVTVRRGEESLDLKAKLRPAKARDITGRELDPRSGGGRTGATFEKTKEGIVVTFVTPLSPADDAGLAEGDLVLKVDGTPVKELDGLLEEVRNKNPGDKVAILVRRDGKEREITVTLGRPKE